MRDVSLRPDPDDQAGRSEKPARLPETVYIVVGQVRRLSWDQTEIYLPPETHIYQRGHAAAERVRQYERRGRVISYAVCRPEWSEVRS